LAPFYIDLRKLIIHGPESSTSIGTQLFQETIQNSFNLMNKSLAIERGHYSEISTSNQAQANLNISKQESRTEVEKLESSSVPKIQIALDFMHIIEAESYTKTDDILEKINEEASKIGYKFNRGPFDKGRGYFSIYCKYKPRTSSKKISSEEEAEVESNSKKIFCNAFYRFKKIGGLLDLISSDQNHTHEGLDTCELSENMKLDLRFIKKDKRIIDIIDFLEMKYRCQGLNYQKVYYQFRKLKPLFGLNDCAYFANYLKQKGFSVDVVLQEDEQTLSRLFFASPVMLQNYSLFGDMLIMDTTYNVNKYKILLLVFSGIAADGRNIVFGMACLNDETVETYAWALKSFFTFHKTLPTLFVTDGDLALCKVVQDLKQNNEHFLCQWHISRNFYRNLSFLKKKDQSLFKRLLGLPYVQEKEIFDQNFEALKTFLNSEKSYEKSLKYIESIWEIKHKWANLYKPRIFSAGAHTTSRAESTNALIKRYLGKQSELSAMIELIKDLDNSPAFQIKKVHSSNTKEPLLENLKDKIGEVIFAKHQDQYSISAQFTVLVEEEGKSYQVVFDNQTAETEEEEAEPKIRTITKLGINILVRASCLLKME